MDKTRKKLILYWAAKPLTILKSTIGWRLKDEVPNWAFFVVWSEFTLVELFTCSTLSCIGAIRINEPLGEFIHGLVVIIISSPLIGLIFMPPIMLILYFIKVILRKGKR